MRSAANGTRSRVVPPSTSQPKQRKTWYVVSPSGLTWSVVTPIGLTWSAVCYTANPTGLPWSATTQVRYNAVYRNPNTVIRGIPHPQAFERGLPQPRQV